MSKYRVRFIGIEGPPTFGHGTVAPSYATYEVIRPDGSTLRLLQPCLVGEARHVNGSPVWGWDGDMAAPTLTPSYLCKLGRESGNLRLHWFLIRGVIQPCGDNEAEVAP